MGITCDIEEVYRKGSFVVLHVTIVHTDIHHLLSHKLSAEKLEKADRVLECVKSFARCLGKEDFVDTKVQDTMNSKIVEVMCQKLPEVLPEKMAEKGLIVELIAKPEAHEA